MFDRLTDDLKVRERDLAQSALADDRATRLMTIPGINMVVALALIAAIGDIKRFAKPEPLVGYLGLNPSVRQSGPGPAYHGRITKQGCGHARGSWSRRAGSRRAARARSAVSFSRAEPARATCRCRRDGTQACYPDLAFADQTRELPLVTSGAARQKTALSRAKAGHKSARGQKGTAPADNLKSQRDQERRWVEQGETAIRPLCDRLERKRAEGAHGCRKGGATIIGLRGRTFTSCPALCHAVIRARPQISKERGPSTVERDAVLGMVKTKPPAVGCGQS